MNDKKNYSKNWKTMQLFDYKCNNLPLDIQKLIILNSEHLWYSNQVNKIIKSWYTYIAKKIVAQYIYMDMEIQLVEVYPYIYANILIESIIVKIIDPLKYYKQIMYICKILKGTEDCEFWKSFLEKVATGLNCKYQDEYKKIQLINNGGNINLSFDDINKLNKIIKINNNIIELRNKFLLPIFFGSYTWHLLASLKSYSFINQS